MSIFVEATYHLCLQSKSDEGSGFSPLFQGRASMFQGVIIIHNIGIEENHRMIDQPRNPI